MHLTPPRPMSRFLVLLLATLATSASLSAQLTWTRRNGLATGGEFLWGAAGGDPGLVVVGTNGKILHSTDGGLTWIPRESGTTNWLVAVTYGDGRYIAVGDNGTILTSPNALTWMRVTNSGTTARINNVAFANGQFVAVGEQATIVTSTDGNTWTRVPLSSSTFNGWFRGLSCSPRGQWTATGQDGARAVWDMQSRTGWAVYPPASTISGWAGEHLEAVVYLRETTYAGLPVSQFLAVGSNGVSAILWAGAYNIGYVPSMLDGAGRRVGGTAQTAHLRTLMFGNGVAVATGENGTVLTAPGPEGPWTPAAIDTSKNLVGGAFVNRTLLLVGENETIFQSQPLHTSRLGNISTLGVAGAGDQSLIAGIVVQGPRAKQMLIRGIGPALAQFGVSGSVPSLVLSAYNQSNQLFAQNIRWEAISSPTPLAVAAAARQVGAFPLATGSNDVALLIDLLPGRYTFQLASATGVIGNALLEAYDADELDSTSARAVNFSTRGQAGRFSSGDVALTTGIVVDGQSSRTVLIRGVGPALARFGVTDALPDPVIRVYRRDGLAIASNDNWTDETTINGRTFTREDLQAAAAGCGAFSLATDSKDAALLLTLVPGNYTVELRSANGVVGTALIETYDVP